MATPAQIAANRRNAQLSTGPRTEEGKGRSRANALKHGFTGDGVVVPEGDLEQVRQVRSELESELKPSGRMGRILLQRVAALSVRLDRCLEHEVAIRDQRKREAVKTYDDARLAEVEKAHDWIAAEPETHARRLEQTPEGVLRKIQAWKDLAHDLDYAGNRWGYHHWRQADNLMGRKPEMPPYSRFGALCQILWNQPSYLEPTGLDPAAKDAWARQELHAVIDQEIGRLQEVLAAFDREALERDRLEAEKRAIFDPSPEATLAQKYEAAAERGLFRAWDEFRRLEAENRREANPEPKPAKQLAPKLASFEPPASPAPPEVTPAPETPPLTAPQTPEVATATAPHLTSPVVTPSATHIRSRKERRRAAAVERRR